ncbi:unnamed protein product, partial [Gadus morhua 'NCC']
MMLSSPYLACLCVPEVIFYHYSQASSVPPGGQAWGSGRGRKGLCFPECCGGSVSDGGNGNDPSPAEVPMMSPNGSIPPIHVPPGYISQVLEDNTGVRRVVVTPQSPECYPPSYSPALSPTHHLPPYLAHHPHFIPNSFYPPVSPGDLPPHQYYQHHLPPMYGDPEIIPVYGMSNYIGREEAYSKPQPKKIKEQRQLERQNRLNSPPTTLYKGSLGTAHNGYSSNKSHCPLLGSLGSGGGVSSPGGKKPERRLRSSPRSSEPDTHTP